MNAQVNYPKKVQPQSCLTATNVEVSYHNTCVNTSYALYITLANDSCAKQGCLILQCHSEALGSRGIGQILIIGKTVLAHSMLIQNESQRVCMM